MAVDTPPAKSKPPAKPAGPKGVLTGNVGPLPVWGWGVVAIAGVFLYRRIAGGGQTAAQAGTVPGAGGQSPVVVVPGGGGSFPQNPAQTTVVAGPTGVPTEVAVSALADSYRSGGGQKPPLNAAGRQFLQDLHANPNQAQASDWFAGNMARRDLGLPYVIPGKGGSNAWLYNPQTGTAIAANGPGNAPAAIDPQNPGYAATWQQYGQAIPAGAAGH
jgi:hypothetical protein